MSAARGATLAGVVSMTNLKPEVLLAQVAAGQLTPRRDEAGELRFAWTDVDRIRDAVWRSA